MTLVGRTGNVSCQSCDKAQCKYPVTRQYRSATGIVQRLCKNHAPK